MWGRTSRSARRPGQTWTSAPTTEPDTPGEPVAQAGSRLDGEAAVLAGRLLVLGLFLLDVVLPARADGGEERLDVLLGPLDEELDPAVGQVLDVAGDGASAGDLDDGGPEADALRAAGVVDHAGDGSVGGVLLRLVRGGRAVGGRDGEEDSSQRPER